MIDAATLKKGDFIFHIHAGICQVIRVDKDEIRVYYFFRNGKRVGVDEPKYFYPLSSLLKELL